MRSIRSFPRITTSWEPVSSEHLNQLAPEWRRLTQEDGIAEPCMQPEWFTAFLTHSSVAQSREDTLLTLRWNGRLRALLPLKKSQTCFMSIPMRTLRSLSSVHASRFDIIHGRQEIASSTLAFWKALKVRDDWDAIEALNIPQGGAFERLLLLAQGDGYLVAQWPTQRSPFLPLPSLHHDPFTNCPTTSKLLRLRIQAAMNHLTDRGTLALHLTTTAPATFIYKFMALDTGHNRSKTRRECDLAHCYSDILHHAAEEHYLHAYALHLNNEPIAMHIGFLMNNRYFIARSVSDRTYTSFLPDHILMKLCIEELCRRAVHTLDFLGTNCPFTSAWTHHYRPHAHCYILRPTLQGYGIRNLITHIAPPVRRMKQVIRTFKISK